MRPEEYAPGCPCGSLLHDESACDAETRDPLLFPPCTKDPQPDLTAELEASLAALDICDACDEDDHDYCTDPVGYVGDHRGDNYRVTRCCCARGEPVS
jgi:hypothetical protein